MYDMHYDLLTILYYNFKNNNKYADINKLIDDCKKIYNNNIIGGIINLYFMSSDEMFEEIGITAEELKDVKKMFKDSIDYLEDLKNKGIIPSDIDFLYSIEGCDYLKDEFELDDLYELGLRSILPVWNNKNKFASGNRSDDGLTDMGVRLIKRAVDLGIIIDVSHANKRSFNDILDVLEECNNYVLIASHSNVRSLCDRDRNLDDDQLIRLRDMGGYISLFTNGNFLSSNNKKLSYKERQDMYLKHLDYLINMLEFSYDKILVATDDMNFSPDLSYHNLEAFPIDSISSDLYILISENYGDDVARKILYDNPKKIISGNKKSLVR